MSGINGFFEIGRDALMMWHGFFRHNPRHRSTPDDLVVSSLVAAFGSPRRTDGCRSHPLGLRR
jgi:hypothetical protein